jgi:hypothetical protein
VIAPGIERFEYFRKITRIARGQEPPESLRDVQELYDTYFLNSPEWEARRLNKTSRLRNSVTWNVGETIRILERDHPAGVLRR